MSVVFDNSKLKRAVPAMTTTIRFDQGVRIALNYIQSHPECQVEDPEFDEAKTVENTVEIAVQINGKTKGTISIAKDEAKDAVLAKAKEEIQDKLTGNVIKEIYVPGRIVNIVMK